ncbi:MAG TPA: metallophosphoesterase family protein [Trebonia sp.]|jgi:Icc protein|nr:metallophosphoesterase family protein [Trebonia sp.]
MAHMDCCRPSRRQALLWGSLAAAAPVIVGGLSVEDAKASTTGASSSGLLAIDLEVATVTDTSAVITWFTGSATQTDEYGFPLPVATDTQLQIGQWDTTTLTLVPGTLQTVFSDSTATPYHYAEVTGLEPGTAYGYVALSNGQQAQQTSMQFPVGVGGSLDYPGTFTTLATPPGTYLFTLALSNDLHFGEGDSGIIENNWPPSFEQTSGLPPYPQVMLQAMLGDLRQPDRAADRLIVAGDLTSNGYLSQAQGVKQLLDGWGTLQQDYFVSRGNHDRSEAGTDWNTCTVVPGTNPVHYDCWGDVFPYPLQSLQHYEVGGLRIMGLDTTTLDDAGGTMDQAQLEELRDVLRKDKDQPTLLFGHHPITYESAATTEAGPSFDIDRPTAITLQDLYAKTPGVFFHHSGHTHRNKRTYLLDNQQNPIQSVEFLEVGATKEYPGGYSLIRLYTGGYMVSYYKNRTQLALAWAQRTRHEYYSLYPHYMLGTIADRNHTVTRDLSGLRPLA